ncbi:MAG: hypothetical protein ACE5IG_03090 [Dehalococcoidia bacterium]
MTTRDSPTPSAARSFYGRALSRAQRLKLDQAREVEGVDQEIAVLRLILRRLLEESPERVELLFKGLNLLVRAVAIRYKLSPKAQEDLSQSIAGVLQGIGGALWPEEPHGG